MVPLTLSPFCHLAALLLLLMAVLGAPPVLASAQLPGPLFGRADAMGCDGFEEAVVAAVEAGGVLRLEDGRRVILAGLELPQAPLSRDMSVPWPAADESRAALVALSQATLVRFYRCGRDSDRYGRKLAQAFTADGRWLQGEMLRLGWARVASTVEDRKAVPLLLDAEAEARIGRRGLWGMPAYAVRRPREAWRFVDSVQVLEGKVTSVTSRGNVILVRFGEGRRPALTLRIPKGLMARWEADPRLAPYAEAPWQLRGHWLRMRGWIGKGAGPVIEVSEPVQIRNGRPAPTRDAGRRPQGGAMKGDRSVTADLYPPIEPHRQGWLPVGGRHRLYWEESGNPMGVPVVFLHGGPGAGCAAVHRRFFDPEHYRIILFDQRGAGRSVPTAEIEGNTTAFLIDDIEALRQHLGIDRWLVFGGSWGSTLALAYGQTHPERCLGFVLRGIFLFRQDEVDWFLYQMGRFFPEAGRAFRGYLPDSEQSRLLEAYYRRLTDPSPAVHMPAAKAWCTYEESCSRLFNGPADLRLTPAALAMARIEAHYMIHEGFLEKDQLLHNLHRLHGLPATIVQGRYDVVCPIATADQLARAWPGTSYCVVTDAGHSAMEPGIRAALVAATNRFRSLG